MIEFKNLSVSFAQNKVEFSAVKNVSFKINDADIFGIVGASGAGKSTLLRTINLLQKPTKGNVLINGNDITNYSGKQLRELRQNIGMIFQNFNLWESKTVYDNIAFVLKNAGLKQNEIKVRVNELLELVNLSDKINSFPSSLSGGQKQRVAIARAIANNADILLCDEPTSALDAETTNNVLELLKEINQKLKITIVIITHELDVVKSICNNVAVMNQGELVEINEVFKLFTEPQKDFTKRLIQNTVEFSIPDELMNGTIIKLQYKGEKAAKPVLFQAAKDFKIEFSIIHGKIEYIKDQPFGILYVKLTGKEINSAIEYLKTQVDNLEVITND